MQIDALVEWNTTPMTVGIDPEPSFIANDPLPMLTICNPNQKLGAAYPKCSRICGNYSS